DGAIPRVILRRQLSVTRTIVSYYREKLLTTQLPLLIGFVILLVLGRRHQLLKQITARWPLWTVALAGLGMYALVHVERRYIAVLFTLLWIGLYSGLNLPDSQSQRRAAFLVVLAVAIAMAAPTGLGVLRHLAHIQGPPHKQWRVAENLRALGVKPGDRLARMGGRFGTVYWARLLGVSVVAEVPLANAGEFWHASPELQAQVIEKFRELGVTA